MLLPKVSGMAARERSPDHDRDTAFLLCAAQTSADATRVGGTDIRTGSRGLMLSGGRLGPGPRPGHRQDLLALDDVSSVPGHYPTPEPVERSDQERSTVHCRDVPALGSSPRRPGGIYKGECQAQRGRKLRARRAALLDVGSRRLSVVRATIRRMYSEPGCWPLRSKGWSGTVMGDGVC